MVPRALPPSVLRKTTTVYPTQWLYGKRSGSTSSRHHSNNSSSLSRNRCPPIVQYVQKQWRKGWTSRVDWTINDNSKGGHLLVGHNGSGKSLLTQSLREEFLKDNNNNSIEYVSFESHQELLLQGGTVYRALAQGNLNKAAQFFIVRFGLYPILHQDIVTLSNGQIKKVLIARALSTRPVLLVMDNAFDGLDAPSRKILASLVSKTLQGFRQDRMLVQGVSVKNAADNTQVLLLTHRPDEVVPEIEYVTTVTAGTDLRTHLRLETTRREGRDAEELLRASCQVDGDSTVLPEEEEIRSWWWNKDSRKCDKVTTSLPPDRDVIVQTKNLTITRNEKVLLDKITWTVSTGQRWLVAGGNGAGKSTLSRLLVQGTKPGESTGTLSRTGLGGDEDAQRGGIGWVSTELHLSLTHSDMKVRDILLGNPHYGTVLPTPQRPPRECEFEILTNWFGICHLLNRPFLELSLGEQRMVLITSAYVCRPSIVVLDEPCQGLDPLNRKLVLKLVNLICQSTDIAIVYITHHTEDAIPTIGHVLALKDGRAVFQGDIEEYHSRSS